MKRLARELVSLLFFCGLMAWSPGALPQQKTAGKADQSKYGKYILSKEIYKVIPTDYTGTSLLSHNGELKSDLSIGYHCVTKPISFEETHSHNNAEILCFIGGNPRDITDFGAEVDVSLGPEDRKSVV